MFHNLPMDGGRGAWVSYSYCISIVIMTFRRYSEPQFVPEGESRVAAGLPYILISLFFGWWGCPFGLIFTPLSIIENLSGGKVVETVGGGPNAFPPMR